MEGSKAAAGLDPSTESLSNCDRARTGMLRTVEAGMGLAARQHWLHCARVRTGQPALCLYNLAGEVTLSCRAEGGRHRHCAGLLGPCLPAAGAAERR